jgi:hypothetical protein
MKRTGYISLTPGETVRLHIRRARVGMVLIWVVIAVLIVVLTVAALAPFGFGEAINLGPVVMPGFSDIIIFIDLAIVVAGCVATYVYCQNEMVITNKRAIQRIVLSPFNETLNTVDLSMVEDVSLRREGILQYILRLGTIRLSTVGDETTYTFRFVSTPEDEIDLITQLVHAEQNNTSVRPNPHISKKKGLR